MAEWKDYQSIYTSYILNKIYPENSTKHEKRPVRDKSQSFAVREGVLLHKNTNNVFCRVIVDDSEKSRILSSLHADDIGGSHYDQNATIKKVTDRFWWKNVSNDARDFVRGCIQCQKCNPSNKAPPSTLHPLSVRKIFHRWGIDMVGPAEGIHRFLTSLVCRYGSCHVLVLHDQGREFNNQLVKDLYVVRWRRPWR